MSAGLSASDCFLRLSDAARSTPGGPAPARELARLLDGVHRWLSGSASDDRCFGIVTGESGHGQRELFEALEEICDGSGINRLRSPGRLGDLVQQLLHDGHLSRDADGGGVDVPRDVLLELLKVTPGPRGLDPPDRLPDLGPGQDRLRLIDAVARALFEVASRGPLILILGDLDAVDEPGHELLLPLTRMLCARKARGSLPPLLVIASVCDEREAALAFGNLREEARRLTAFQMDTPGYSLDDLRRLSRARFRDDQPAPDERRVLSRTRGSVRHVSWLYRHARDEFDAGLSNGPAHWNELLELSFSELVRRCFASLTEAASRIVSSLAVLGRPVPERVVREVASGSIDEDSGRAAPFIGELPDRDWSVVTRGADGKVRDVGIVDPDVACVILDVMSPQERDSLRHGAARALEREGRRDPRWLPCALRHHASISADWPEDSTLRAAVRSARLLVSPSAAMRLLEEPLLRRLASSPAHQEAWLQMYAELLRDAGETRRAIGVYRELRELSDEPEVKARCCRMIGDLAGTAGEREERLQAYEEGLEALAGDTRNAECLRLLCSIARARLEEKRPGDARAAVSRSLELIEGGARGTRDELLEVSWLVRETFPEDPTRGRLIDDELGRCTAGTDTLGRFGTLCRLARLHAGHGRSDEEMACLKEAAATASESGSRALVAEAGWLSACAGNGGFKSLTKLRRCLDVFDDLGDLPAAQRVNVHLLHSELESGKFSRAGRRAQIVGERWAKMAALDRRDSGRSGEQIGSYVPPLVVYSRGALLGGDHHCAQETIEQALAELGDTPRGDVVQVANRTAAQLSLATGNVARAYEQFLRGLRCALDARSPDGTAEAFLGFCEFFLQGGAFATAIGLARGGLALLRVASKTRCELSLRCLLGRLAVEVGDRAEEEFERAAALAASLDMPAETCQLNLERGWERYHRGEFDGALSLAEQGIQIASQCGFRPLHAELLLLVGATQSVALASRAAESLEEALAESRALGMPRLEWEVLRAIASMPGLQGERAGEASSRADEIASNILGRLPRFLRGITWCSRIAVVNHGTRRSSLSACAG